MASPETCRAKLEELDRECIAIRALMRDLEDRIDAGCSEVEEKDLKRQIARLDKSLDLIEEEEKKVREQMKKEKEESHEEYDKEDEKLKKEMKEKDQQANDHKLMFGEMEEENK